MKISILFYLFIGLFFNVASAQTYTVAQLRGLSNPTGSGVYQSSDYGGGSWKYLATTGATDNTGTILVNTVTGGQFNRIFSGAYNILWFGAAGDGVTIDSIPWVRAKAAVPPQGGTIYFPKGRYMSGKRDGWQVYRNNLIIKGDGINATYLLTPDPSNASGITLGLYRDAGWSLNPSTLYTYVDSAAVGQSWITLKPGQDMSPFKRNSIFFFNAGANYYDQYYGEFEVVDTVVGNKIFLKYHLSKDYTADRSSYYGILSANFTPPAVGATAVAQITNPPTATVNVAISLGTDLYQVTAVSGSNITLRNLGKGNGTEVISAGTRVFKARAIYITPSTVYNTVVEDLTIEGHRKSLVVSNSVKSYFNRVRFMHHKGALAGGIWLDGDDGRDFIMENCEVYSDVPITSQMARSFGDIKIKTTKLFQASLEFSEFNYNFDVEDCDIHVHKSTAADSLLTAINVGQSTSTGRIFKNRIFASRLANAILASDIQAYRATSRAPMVISNNMIYADRCNTAINVVGAGTVLIEGNSIIGNVVTIFGASDAVLYGVTNQVDISNRFIFGTSLVIRGNTFVGYANSFLNRTDPFNLDVQDNIVNLLGPAYRSDAAALSLGNIIRGSVASVTPTLKVPAERMVFKNNWFKGWNYNRFSINLQRPINSRVDISNNHFVDQAGTYRADKDFILNLQDVNKSVYAGVNYLPLIKDPEVDLGIYAEFVKRNGGQLTAADLNVGRQLLKEIYFNNLRSKIEILNPMLGDSSAARVPLLGWEKSMYQSLAAVNMVGADFSRTGGWKGNGTNKYGVFAQVKDLDYSNTGLFVNLTIPGTLANATYLGSTGGTGPTTYFLRKNGTVLQGLGQATIEANYTEGPGFIYSGQTTGSQLNFLDLTTKPKTSNTTLTNQLTPFASFLEANMAFLARGATTLSGTAEFTDATIGAYGATKYLNLTETQTLDQILYNSLTALGRPTQADPNYVVSQDDLREGKTPIVNSSKIPLSRVVLNALYPMAVKGQKIYCPAVGLGILGTFYEKVDTDGNWLAVLYPKVL